MLIDIIVKVQMSYFLRSEGYVPQAYACHGLFQQLSAQVSLKTLKLAVPKVFGVLSRASSTNGVQKKQ